MRVFTRSLALALLVALFLPSTPITAQSPIASARGSHTFAIALGVSDPLLISLSYAGAKSGRLGWYVDVGFSAAPDNKDNPDYYPNISPLQASFDWGDRPRGTIDNYLYGLIGPSLVLSPHVRIAGGVGYAMNRRLRKWHDPLTILGTNGDYITDGFSGDETNGLAYGGALQIRGGGGATLHLGFASPMNAAQVGIGYTF